MEEQVYNKLSKTDQELLASLFETQSAKTILRAGVQYQEDKALHIAMTAPDMENVMLNRGMIQGARFLYDLMKLAAKKNKKSQG